MLRCAQHEALHDKEQTASIARNIVAGKIKNTRTVLLRGARETKDIADQTALRKAAARLGQAVTALDQQNNLDVIRGE